jgi:hypothetical protein
MAELKWKDAIIKVFEDEKKALNYIEIAEIIAKKGYRKSLGATPQDTVSAYLTTDINTNKENSTFVRVAKGIYVLRRFFDDGSLLLTDDSEQDIKSVPEAIKDRMRIINAFGIYWNRDLVYWKTNPELLGIQQIGAKEVNFKDQKGVYLLHDTRETIYVGQAIEQTLGQRLKNHTSDRLGGRWNRFSWFGFYPVTNTGKLSCEVNFKDLTVRDLGDILEAILIESIEPRQNRKQGNLFSGIEYLQQEAPEIKKKMQEQVLKELARNIY